MDGMAVITNDGTIFTGARRPPDDRQAPAEDSLHVHENDGIVMISTSTPLRSAVYVIGIALLLVELALFCSWLAVGLRYCIMTITGEVSVVLSTLHFSSTFHFAVMITLVGLTIDSYGTNNAKTPRELHKRMKVHRRNHGYAISWAALLIMMLINDLNNACCSWHLPESTALAMYMIFQACALLGSGVAVASWSILIAYEHGSR